MIRIGELEEEFCGQSVNRLRKAGWKDFDVCWPTSPALDPKLSDLDNFNKLMGYIKTRPRAPWIKCTDPYGNERTFTITISFYATLIGIEFEEAWELKKVCDILGFFNFQRMYLGELRNSFNVPASMLGYS